jgi:hypothetical protein
MGHASQRFLAFGDPLSEQSIWYGLMGDMIRKNNDLLNEKLAYLTDHIIIRVRNIRILAIFYMRMLRFVANFTCVFDQNFTQNLRIYAIRKLILT